ncbi:hypothetical protein GCM10023317_57840 [Actinopolymorpha pittospori]
MTGESWGRPSDLIVARTPSRLSVSSVYGSKVLVMVALLRSSGDRSVIAVMAILGPHTDVRVKEGTEV